MNTHDLKGLQVRLTKAEAESKSLLEEVKLLQKRASESENLANALRKQINDITDSTKEIIISEHAYIRYFERVSKYDLDKLREIILPEKTIALIDQMGNGTYGVNGFKVKVKDRTVITII